MQRRGRHFLPFTIVLPLVLLTAGCTGIVNPDGSGDVEAPAPFHEAGASVLAWHTWNLGKPYPYPGFDEPVYRSFVVFGNGRAILVAWNSQDGNGSLRVQGNESFSRSELQHLFMPEGLDLGGYAHDAGNETPWVAWVQEGVVPWSTYRELAAAITWNWSHPPEGAGLEGCVDCVGPGSFGKLHANATPDEVEQPADLQHRGMTHPGDPATLAFQRVIRAFHAAEDAFVPASSEPGRGVQHAELLLVDVRIHVTIAGREDAGDGWTRVERWGPHCPEAEWMGTVLVLEVNETEPLPYGVVLRDIQARNGSGASVGGGQVVTDLDPRVDRVEVPRALGNQGQVLLLETLEGRVRVDGEVLGVGERVNVTETYTVREDGVEVEVTEHVVVTNHGLVPARLEAPAVCM